MASNSSLALKLSSITSKSKEEHQAELNYVIRNLFLRRDLDNWLVILKGQRMGKVPNLISLSSLDLENLSCTLPSKETLKLIIANSSYFQRIHQNLKVRTQE